MQAIKNKIKIIDRIMESWDREDIYLAMGEYDWDETPLIIDIFNRFLHENVPVKVAQSYLDLCRQELQQLLVPKEKKGTLKPEPIFLKPENILTSQITQVFSGNPDFGRKMKCTITRSGRAITRIQLRVVLPELPEGSFWVHDLGFKLIRRADLLIGGSIISRIDPQVLLSTHLTSITHQRMKEYDPCLGYAPGQTHLPENPKEIIVPLYLEHSFAGHMTLPLYNEVQVDLEFEYFHDLIVGQPINNPPQIRDASLLVTYSDLYREDLMALQPDKVQGIKYDEYSFLVPIHQYQTQNERVHNGLSKTKLFFNHICDQLFVMVKDAQGNSLPIERISLMLNGSEYIVPESMNIPRHQNWYDDYGDSPSENIYYFPLRETSHLIMAEVLDRFKPELFKEHFDHLKGLNFSRIESAILNVYLLDDSPDEYELHVWCRNYNLMRMVIKNSGHCPGLAYSN